jgi:phosphatidylglycerophosphatase A
MNRLRLAVVSCGFLGCSPVAPGTFGTLGGVAIAALLARTDLFGLWALLAAALIYAVGQPLGQWAEDYAGKKDPGIFVLDEVVGYLITVAWIAGPSLLGLVTGFFVFRFFDILKPWPGRRMERIRGGHGILLDDVVAGIYGFGLMAAARAVFPGAGWTV